MHRSFKSLSYSGGVVQMNLEHSERPFRRILGVEFFVGDVHGAIERMSGGGLLVVPAAPALKDLPTNPEYRDALLNADLAITDSAFMTIVWNLIARDNIRRVSGLEYLQHLLQQSEFTQPGNAFWVMAGTESARRNSAWLTKRNIPVPPEYTYVAPLYGSKIEDVALRDELNRLQPKHVIITVGGGTQERLGLYLKRNLNYKPAIHCIGAAMAFLSGDQVRIPDWADRFYLGWLFRCVTSPRRFVPRYWSARRLLPLMLRYRGAFPE